MSVVEYLVIGGVILLLLLFCYFQQRARKEEMLSYVQVLTRIVITRATNEDIIDIMAHSVNIDPKIGIVCVRELKNRGLTNADITKCIEQAAELARTRLSGKNFL